VFRHISVFGGPFTLEAAEAVAGAGAGLAVLRLVDCSLVAPPRTGRDRRARYQMLETLRGYGWDQLAAAGELAEATVALARYAVAVAEQAAAGLQTNSGEQAGARWLDAEDALTRHALAWAQENDPDSALRLAVALSPWWRLRGRSVAAESLLRAAAGHAVAGSPEWCAAYYWLGQTAMNSSEFNAALGHFTAVRDVIAGAGPSRALADSLGGRSVALANLGRLSEAVEDGERALALARSMAYPGGVALASADCAIAAYYGGDLGRAMRYAQQAQGACTDHVPGWICRVCANVLGIVLTDAGELAAAERCCEDALTRCREAGDLQVETALLSLLARLDLAAGRLPAAAAHLRESLQVATRIGEQTEQSNCINICGHLCATTGRWADALTLWAAHAARIQQAGLTDPQEDALRRREPLRQAARALGPERTREAKRRGAAMTLATAAEFAEMVAAADVLVPRSAPGPAQLSRRERELVTLVAQGRTDAQIAGHLTISVSTVRSHLERIRDKTGCRRRADLTRLALQDGLV
jgi:DNA-binding CsgD family transcriptional regulator/tetratricopeptide (TPR) repeat protein